MVELGVLLCESFDEENVPVNGVNVAVAGANCVSDIMGSIEDITKMAQKASHELNKPCFCGVTITVRDEEFIAGCKEGSSMELSEKSITDCISFILAKVFDEMVVLENDPVDDLLKKLGITRMDDTNNGCFGN
jgi:hypothetical protein